MAGKTRSKRNRTRKPPEDFVVPEAPPAAETPASPPESTEPEDDRLTARRRAFAREYPRDHNATQAAIRAGFSPDTAGQAGSRLLKNVNVARLIEQAEERATIAAGVDVQYVVENAVEILERCLQRRPVEYYDKDAKMMVQATDEDGNDIWEFDSNGAMKAVTLLSKKTGGFTDRTEHSLSASLEELLTASRDHG